MRLPIGIRRIFIDGNFIRLMTTKKTPKPERPKVVGFPNELANDEPGSFRQAEFLKFIYDPACQGLPCQKIWESWQVRVLNREERELDRLEAEKRQMKMPSRFLEPKGQSELQIEMQASRGRWRKRWGINFMRWEANLPDERTKRLESLRWWRNNDVLDRQDIFPYRLAEDPDFAEEVGRGDWD